MAATAEPGQSDPEGRSTRRTTFTGGGQHQEGSAGLTMVHKPKTRQNGNGKNTPQVRGDSWVEV